MEPQTATRPAVPDGPVLQRPRLVRWFAERPRIADVLVILACTVPTVAVLIFATPAHAWLGYVCAAGVAVTLWWRRSHPLAVLLGAVGIASLNPIYAPSLSVASFESVFATFALASLARLRVALLGYLASNAVILAGSGLAVLLGIREEVSPVLLQPGPLIALALGVAARASRSRRAAVEELVTMREERAAAAERSRIAAEMHDVVAHSVTVMIALAGGARAGWQKHPERAREALDQLGSVGARTLEEMQRILRVLREGDGELDRALETSGHNLPPLGELVDVFRAAGLPVTLTGEESVAAVDPALRTTVYRIVQEALTNALRHAAGATRADVEIERVELGGVETARRDDELVVTVTDDGRPGASSAGPAAGTGAGIGLRAMRERASAFGGRLEAGPLVGEDGWRTRVSLPLGEGEQTEAPA